MGRGRGRALETSICLGFMRVAVLVQIVGGHAPLISEPSQVMRARYGWRGAHDGAAHPGARALAQSPPGSVAIIAHAILFLAVLTPSTRVVRPKGQLAAAISILHGSMIRAKVRVKSTKFKFDRRPFDSCPRVRAMLPYACGGCQNVAFRPRVGQSLSMSRMGRTSGC